MLVLYKHPYLKQNPNVKGFGHVTDYTIMLFTPPWRPQNQNVWHFVSDEATV